MGNLPFFNVGKVQHLITEFCFFLFEVLLAYCICNFYAVLIFFWCSIPWRCSPAANKNVLTTPPVFPGLVFLPNAIKNKSLKKTKKKPCRCFQMKPKLSAFSHLFILTLVEVAVDSWPFSLVNISYVQTVLKASGWRGGGLWTPTQLFSGLRSSTPYVKTFRMSVQLSLISLSFFFFSSSWYAASSSNTVWKRSEDVRCLLKGSSTAPRVMSGLRL